MRTDPLIAALDGVAHALRDAVDGLRKVLDRVHHEVADVLHHVAEEQRHLGGRLVDGLHGLRVDDSAGSLGLMDRSAAECLLAQAGICLAGEAAQPDGL